MEFPLQDQIVVAGLWCDQRSEDRAPELGLHYAVCLFGLEERPTRALGRCLRIALRPDCRSEAVLQFATSLPECSSLD